jgi:2-polyprenyl-6-methoxyphenol hydroxylase-like FAD-dependent oxidoreductase
MKVDMGIRDFSSMNNLCSVQLISTQLMTEKNIRSVFENDPNVTFTQGVTLIDIMEDADSVTITYQDESGTRKSSKVIYFIDPPNARENS